MSRKTVRLYDVAEILDRRMSISDLKSLVVIMSTRALKELYDIIGKELELRYWESKLPRGKD